MPIIPSRAGGEILVNTQVNFDQVAPAGARLANGTYVIVWHDNNSASDGSQASVKAQLYAADGTPIGTEFRVNTFTTGNQQDASVAALGDGGFVVVWANFMSHPLDSSGTAIIGQRYDAAGAKVGVEFLVNTTTNSGQMVPDVTTLANGGFAVSWTDYSLSGGDTDSQAVRMQVFNADASRNGSEFLVNTNTLGNQNVSSITASSSGTVAVVWTDERPTPIVNSTGFFIKMRLFNNGVPGAEIVVSTTPSGNQSNAEIVALTGGRFVAVWTDYSGANGDPVSGIRGRIFEANGTAVGTEFSVNASTASRQDIPRVAALPDGGFVVTWDDLSLTQDTSEYGILGQIFDAAGARVGGEFLVNTTTNDFQRDSAVFATNDGFFVAFTDTNGSVGETSLGPNVRGQRFLYSAGQAFVADAGDDSYTGGAGVDTVDYSAATGAVSADARSGASADGFGAADIFSSIESLIGSAFADLLIGSNVANLLQGGAGADQLYGLDGDDELIGGTGPNLLQGGAGNDTYRAAETGDTIVEFAGEGVDTVVATALVFVLSDFVENLTAASVGAAFVGVGNAIDNIIRGNTARDSLAGAAGNDTLYGGSGTANELVGGTGNDVYVIEAVGDSAIEYAAEGIDRVQTALTSFALSANVEDLTFTGSTSFAGVGNALDNVIRGGTNVDSLSGGAGNDTLHGGSGPANELAGGTGDDIYVVQVRGDTVIEAAGEGLDTVQTSVATYELSANVENLAYTGGISFTGIGNAGDNQITGGARADRLYGRDGADVLIGGALNDELLGGNGADIFRFIGNDGIDRILDFTSGTDRIQLSAATFGAPAFTLVQGVGTQVATGAGATFLFDNQTGFLSYDNDGTGAGLAVTFALLNAGLTLQVGDFGFA